MQEQNPYDFITNSQAHKPAGGLNLGGGKNKLLVSVVFIAVMILILVVGVSFLLSLSKTNNQDLVTLRAQQTELLRIIDLGEKDVTDISVKNKLASLQALVASDGAKLTDLMKKRNVEPTKAELASLKDADADSALESAKQQGNYDQAILDQVASRSNKYYEALKSSLSEATTSKEKEILNTSISNLVTTVQK